MSSKDWCSTAWPCRGRYWTAHHVEHFRSKANIVAIPLGADRVLSLKKGGPHKQGKERLGYTYLSERESRWKMDKRSGSPTAPPPPAILNKHLAQCTLPRTAMCCHSSFTTALFPFPFSVSEECQKYSVESGPLKWITVDLYVCVCEVEWVARTGLWEKK